MLFLQKILAFWFSRIVIFLILSAVIVILAFACFGSYADDEIITSALYSICLLLSTTVIELIRKSSSGLLWGFYWTKETLKEIFYGKIFALSALSFIGLVGVCSGAGVSFHSVEIMNVLYMSIFYFFVGFFEEMVFRGLIFQTLMERFGIIKTTITVSLLFGFAHYFNPNISIMAICNIVLAGICLSLMYIRTRCLWMPIMFHWVWNFSQEFFLGSPVSGLKSHDSFSTLDWIRLNTMPTLFGGDFGIEGGLLTSFVLIFVSVLTVRFFHPSPYIIARLFRRKFAENAL